ncbi:MAG: hypothetical protein A2563_01320 [Candidatus Magasanikbacteria bacterium RIFOXYD1_FULL_40_23]|uniref:Uncharacterized protein n=1 Tax=Candidatus Magasanikbacteria bacterium RIFOXYD1_FULL_40_23 TaxID=1798705 RepID=A0A1F6PAN6_9BACT|nr:MAG: hypothetical protein A2563_01320 [Candidatus Magasanikbacteria bacterium RIFOXYD1_FULL_40_23]
MFILILQRLFLEAILDVFYFPVWWYTKGALHALRQCFQILKNGNASLAPGVWIVNLFVPMYGQFDIQGRIVSFFMRIVQIIARTFALALWFGFCSVLFIIWLALPVVVFYGIVYAV